MRANLPVWHAEHQEAFIAKSKGEKTARSSGEHRNNKRSTDSGRFEEVSKSTAQIVKDAAALLDEGLAAGIVAAKQVQRRFRKERRIDQADFSAALPRFQAVVHEVITLLNDRLDDMRSPENSAPVKDLVNRSHDTVDIAVGMVNSGAEVSTQLVNSPILKRNSENLLKHCSPGERAGLRNFLALPRQTRKAGEVK